VLGVLALGAGAASAGVGIGLGIDALDARDTFESSGLRDLDAHDRALTLRPWTNVAWAGAVVFGVTGVVLLVWSLGGPSSTLKPRVSSLPAFVPTGAAYRF